jgi:hypothetical protein
VEDDKEHSGARKKLDLGSFENANLDKSDSTTETDKDPETPPPPPGYTNPRDLTKQRRTSNLTNDLASSAATFEVDRRAQ